MTQGVGGESPANVQVHLKGVTYPARKDDLIAAAKQNQAPQEILDLLQEFPDGDYGGPQDVMKAYSHAHS